MIHIPHNKDQTAQSPIQVLPAPALVYILLSQHIGTPASALVSVGDKVTVGQCIGAADAFVTAKVHASVSGTVKAIETMPSATGALVQVVVIENDGLDTPYAVLKPYGELNSLSPEEIRSIVRESGLVGMGGAAFPTHVKYAPPKDKKVDTVILNAAECEPYLTCDHRLLLECTEDVLMGLRAVAKAVGATNVYIGIENNKPDAIVQLKACGAEAFAKIKVLPAVYPMGAEKVLVKAVTGRKVANKGIPLDVGVVVCNVATVAQLAKTMRTGMPLTERVLTVSGHFANAGNYQVRVGTLYKDIVHLPVDMTDLTTISGGPMMGFAVPTLNMPVTKGTSGLLLLHKEAIAQSECIRCGNCIDACPLGLDPYQDIGMDECMECGRCAYICPAHIYIVQKARAYKQKLKK